MCPSLQVELRNQVRQVRVVLVDLSAGLQPRYVFSAS